MIKPRACSSPRLGRTERCWPPQRGSPGRWVPAGGAGRALPGQRGDKQGHQGTGRPGWGCGDRGLEEVRQKVCCARKAGLRREGGRGAGGGGGRRSPSSAAGMERGTRRHPAATTDPEDTAEAGVPAPLPGPRRPEHPGTSGLLAAAARAWPPAPETHGESQFGGRRALFGEEGKKKGRKSCRVRDAGRGGGGGGKKARS